MAYHIIKPDIIHASMMNNIEMVKQFVGIYITQSPDDFDKLAQAIAVENLMAIGDAAHHIKPTLEYVGASELRSDFQKLETLAKTTADFIEIAAQYHIVRDKFNLFMQELHLFQDNL